VDNLFSQGSIGSAEIGVFFGPSGLLGGQGELSFGAPDTGLTDGGISYVPLTKTFPASEYWGIDQTITYGPSTSILKGAGIVDTGTTLMLLATDALQKYQKATGAALDKSTGLLRITNDQYKSLQNLNFSIGGKTYYLTRNAQIFPRNLNIRIGGSSMYVYLIVADLGELSSTAKGLTFINGYTFLERYYSVYDTKNKRIGFAPTPYTDADVN